MFLKERHDKEAPDGIFQPSAKATLVNFLGQLIKSYMHQGSTRLQERLWYALLDVSYAA